MTQQDYFIGDLPRSVLHAQIPIGLGTPHVESLSGYFCRLSNSHACTTNDLTNLIIEKIDPNRWNSHCSGDGKSRFVWYERSVSGIGEGALTWASMLSELTGVVGLDKLTMLPLQNVLSPKALMAQQARWCPHCFDEDVRSGKTPYLRLAWDVSVNKVCSVHHTPLVSRCHHCERSNVRNNANFVIPGWCTACDHFLGYPEQSGPAQMQSGEDLVQIEQARRIGELLAVSSSNKLNPLQTSPEGLHQAIEKLIDEMDGGVCAHFAKRIGMRKTTIHHWKTSRSPLTLDALLRLSIMCNIPLYLLVQGRFEQWEPPSELRQLGLSLSYPEKPGHRTPRQHDWGSIRNYLRLELSSPVVRSLTDIAKDLDIDDRHLYIQVTDEARMVGERYVKYLRDLARKNEQENLAHLREAARLIRFEGEYVTVDNVTQVLGRSKVNSIRNLYTTLSKINEEQEAANDDF